MAKYSRSMSLGFSDMRINRSYFGRAKTSSLPSVTVDRTVDFLPDQRGALILRLSQAIQFAAAYPHEDVQECIKDLMILAYMAEKHMQKKATIYALTLYWRFLLLYRHKIHDIRRSRAVSHRVKYELEKMATKSVAAADWLQLQLKEMHNLSLIRHKTDMARHKGSYANMPQESKISITRGVSKHHLKHRYKSQLSNVFSTKRPLTHSADVEGRLVSCSGRKMLRHVYLPDDSAHAFKFCSYKNSFRNIKTTGIFAATSTEGVLVVSHLIIPEQSKSSRYNVFSNTEELQTYMDYHGLFTIAIAYSEVKKQAGYLSSQDDHDLHQLRQTVPEAFVLVVSNVHDQEVWLGLTEEAMNFISQCTEESLHTHNLVQNLYSEPLHVIKSSKYKIEVVDFRHDSTIWNPPTRTTKEKIQECPEVWD